MDRLDRKSFLTAAGIGSVAAAGVGGVPLVRRLARHEPTELTFRATTGLPQGPFPSYATHVVEGSVDLARGSGLVTSRLLAGHPEAESVIGLPGLSQVIRVTRVDSEGQTLHLRGLVEDRSQLRRGQSAGVEIVLDRKRGVLHAPFQGRQIALQLVKA